MPHHEEDTSERCSWCVTKVGKAKLKRCSQCHYVRYCSKECQRLAWPTHRRSCKVTSAMQAETDSDDVATVVSKWLPSWRHTLFSFGINAMNLANSPRNQLGTHVVFIVTERRRRPPSRAQLLRMVSGELLTRAEFAIRMREMDATEEQVAEWEEDARGDHTLQVQVECEGHMRTLWVSFHSLEEYRRADKKDCQLLADGWQDVLMGLIETGKTWDEHMAEIHARRHGA